MPDPSARRLGLSSTTAHHPHAVVHRALSKAVRQGKVARNVAALVDEDARPVVNHSEMRVLADDDYDRFLAALPGERLDDLFVPAVRECGRRFLSSWAGCDCRRLHRVRHRRLQPPHRGLAGGCDAARGTRPRRPRDGNLGPCRRRSERSGSPLRPGVQYLAIRYSERLADAGAVASVGSKGDSYDNALAETTNGLYKTELIRRRGPWRTVEDVELATLGWVDWFNNRRLHSACDNRPPAEHEALFYGSLSAAPAA